MAKAFDGAKVNDVITFNVGEAYEGADAEIASLLKLKKEETEGHKGNYSFQVEEISRFTPAEINQALFDQIMGKDEVKSEEVSARTGRRRARSCSIPRWSATRRFSPIPPIPTRWS